MSRLPTSGTLSWNDIQNSFGGSNPIGINEYYRDGGIVPFSSLNSGIPTSGTINATNFYGTDGFNGTSGNYTAGTTGGKFPTLGFRNDSVGAYGTDLGLAFTTGSGVKCQLMTLLFTVGSNVFQFAAVSYQGVNASNLLGKTLTSGGTTDGLTSSTSGTVSGGPYNGLTYYQYSNGGAYANISSGSNFSVSIS